MKKFALAVAVVVSLGGASPAEGGNLKEKLEGAKPKGFMGLLFREGMILGCVQAKKSYDDKLATFPSEKKMIALIKKKDFIAYKRMEALIQSCKEIGVWDEIPKGYEVETPYFGQKRTTPKPRAWVVRKSKPNPMTGSVLHFATVRSEDGGSYLTYRCLDKNNNLSPIIITFTFGLNIEGGEYYGEKRKYKSQMFKVKFNSDGVPGYYSFIRERFYVKFMELKHQSGILNAIKARNKMILEVPTQTVNKYFEYSLIGASKAIKEVQGKCRQ